MVISVLAAGILFAGCTEKKEAETTEEKNETMNVQVDTVKTDEFTIISVMGKPGIAPLLRLV